MRLHYAFVLVVGALLAFVDALSTETSTQTESMEINAPDNPQWSQALAVKENDLTTQRLLRQRHATDDAEEERNILTKLGGKLARLSKYNWWLFTGKHPSQIKNPGGYWNFYYNRMIRGGNYA
ncbi:hypothetical protein PRNP1_006866 [Phytophthora ramorum]